MLQREIFMINDCKFLTNIDCVLREVVKDAEETVNHLNNVSSASTLNCNGKSW